MSNTLNIEEIKEKVLTKLEPSGWSRILRSFINSKEFEDILKALVKQAQDGKRFTPTLKNLFRAFEECPYDQLKVVIIGQDPYPQLGVADGIAFSCSLTMEAQPSLEYMLKSVNDTVHGGFSISSNPDLKRWSNQGVLMLNTALTTNIGKVGQHYIIWKPFIAYVLDWLSWNCPGLVYIYMGKKAEEWADCVNDNNYKFFCSHPASAAYNKEEKWDCNDVFNKTSEVLKKNYNFEIEW